MGNCWLGRWSMVSSCIKIGQVEEGRQPTFFTSLFFLSKADNLNVLNITSSYWHFDVSTCSQRTNLLYGVIHFSPLKQSTTRHKFAWLASVSWSMPRRVGQTLQIEKMNRTKKSKNTSWIWFLKFPLKMTAWLSALLPIRWNLITKKSNYKKR